MGNITDSVRRGFAKRSNPLTSGSVPEWWSLASWAGLGAVVVVIAAGAVLDHGHHGGPGPGPHPYPVQTAGTGPVEPSQQPTGPGAAAGGTPGFASRDPAQVPLTGGAGVTTVPAGALNAAQAGLRAQATGDWSGVPVAAGSKTPAPTTAALRLTGPVTVLDPAVTGTGTYLFSAPASRADGTSPVRLQVSVEATATGFAVITG